jgi:VWFA-related protein
MLILGVQPIVSVRAQSTHGGPQSDVTLGTSEVTLDVVARDNKGRPVTNLTESDLAVLEDGVPQEITSFHLVRPTPAEAVAAEPSKGAAAAPAAARPAARSVTTAPEDMKAIAIVFDRLSPDARALANKAATRYVQENFRQGDAVGVFLIDLSLIPLQPYTTNKEQVQEAVREAGLTSGAAFRSQRERIDSLKGSNAGAGSVDVEAPPPSPSDPSGGVTPSGEAGQAQGTQGADAALRQMQIRSAEAFERLERQQQGYATTDALLSIIEGLKLLPGRKAILFFSEGVKIPPEVKQHFEAVISSANLARVTVYAVDAAGLRVDSPDTMTANVMTGIGRRRMNEIGTPNEGRDRMLLRDLETAQDQAQSNVHASLGRLAKETGGYLVSETNDMGGKLRLVDEDLRTYYVVTYVPKNTNYDGSFRQVSVTVRGRT